MKEERRQAELVQALSIDFSLVCTFDLDTGIGKSLRMNDCPMGILHHLHLEVLHFVFAYRPVIDGVDPVVLQLPLQC